MKLIGRDPFGAPKMQVLFCQNSAKLSGKRTERGPDSEKPAGAQGATVIGGSLESLRLENGECDSVKASAFQAVAFLLQFCRFFLIISIGWCTMKTEWVWNGRFIGKSDKDPSFYRKNR